MAKLRNNASSTFGDPTIRVTPNLRGIRTGLTARKLQVPLFGSVGLGCFVAWLALILLTPQDTATVLEPPVGLAQARALLLAGSVLSALAALPSGRHLRTRAAEPVLCILALIGSAAPTLTLLLVTDSMLFSAAWVLGGVGMFCCLLLWWRHIAAITTQRQMAMALASASCVGGVLALAGVLFRADVTAWYIMALGVLSLLVYGGARRRVAKRIESLAEAESEQWDRFRYLFKEELPSVTVLGLFGAMLVCPAMGPDAFPAAVAVAIGLLAAGCITLGGLMLFSKSPSFALLGFSIPAAAVCTVGVLYGPEPVRCVALAVFCAYFVCLAFVHISNVARNARHLFRAYTTALVVVALLDGLSFLLGWVAGLIALQTQGSPGIAGASASLGATSATTGAGADGYVFTVLVLFCLFASAVAFCLFTAHPQARHMPFATGTASGGLRAALMDLTGTEPRAKSGAAGEEEAEGGDAPGNPPDGAQRPTLTEIATGLAGDHGLSQRETEVFVQLIRGHNAQSIAQKLTISGNTVKTHIRNIYAKFDAHSQQDLLDLIDRELPDKTLRQEQN